MKRGDQAREAVKNTIIEAFGANFVDIQDKKIYVNAQDGSGGETIQFAISITMPKTPIAAGPRSDALVGEAGGDVKAPLPRVSLSDEDKKAVDRLMEKLNLPPW